MVGIAIVEDHPLMRGALASYFEKTGRWDVRGTATSLSEAKALIAKISTDVLLLDMQLGDEWGLDIVQWLREREAGTVLPVVAIYSNYNDYAHVSVALSMGVRAYVCKHRDEKELEEALLKALEGGLYIDDTAGAKLKYIENLFSILTKREIEIVTLVKNGLSNKQIASRLNISHRTVENILYAVYDKTGVDNRLALQKL